MEERGTELARKALHVAMGGFAFLLAYLTWWEAALCALAALANNLFLLPRIGGRRVFRGAAAREGRDPGIVLYPVSVLALILLFPHRLEIAAVGWGFLAFGDGLATVAGTLLGRASGPLPWNRAKSWAGLAGFLGGGVPLALVLFAWVGRQPLTSSATAAIVATGIAMAIVESLPLRLNDNLSVPLGAGSLLYAFLLVDPVLLDGAAATFVHRLPLAAAVNVAVALAAYGLGTVNVSGVIHGIILGVLVWGFGGAPAFVVLASFFLLGAAATKVGKGTKTREGTAQEAGGRRGAKHAWANVGVTALFCFLSGASPLGAAFSLGAVAALATAACDTLGSEVGQAFGRRTFLITTFRRVPRGTDGAVSLEGTLAGLAGAAALGFEALALGLVDGRGVLCVVIGALAGTTVESYLGAFLERSHLIDNEVQNFLNTLVGALAAIGVWRWLG